MILNIENEHGQFNQVEVSENFMELCFKNAEIIVGKIENGEVKNGSDVAREVESMTSDDNTRSIIADMVMRKLLARTTASMIIRMLVGD